MALKPHPGGRARDPGGAVRHGQGAGAGTPSRASRKPCHHYVSALDTVAALLCGGMSPNNTGTLITLTAIAKAESLRSDPTSIWRWAKLTAVGDHGTSFGPWQEHTLAGKQEAAKRLDVAGRLAVEKYHAQGFKAWTTYRIGAHLPFMPLAGVAVAREKALWKADAQSECATVQGIQCTKFAGDIGAVTPGVVAPGQAEQDCLRRAKTPAEAALCSQGNCIHDLSFFGHHCMDGIVGGAKIVAGGSVMVIGGLAMLYVLSRTVPGAAKASQAAARVTRVPARNLQRATRATPRLPAAPKPQAAPEIAERRQRVQEARLTLARQQEARRRRENYTTEQYREMASRSREHQRRETAYRAEEIRRRRQAPSLHTRERVGSPS